MQHIGIDVGGTFTDLAVADDEGSIRFYKTPTTPHDPSEGLLAVLQQVASSQGTDLEALFGETELLIHGTTVATNALLERRGARVGLLTTLGFRDVIEIREGLKEDRYNVRMAPAESLVPRHRRVGVPERVNADGSIETKLDEEAVRSAIRTLASESVEALAVCLLFSFVNASHEQRIAEILEEELPHTYVSFSHQVLPEIKEFDRFSTTVVNAYVGPVLATYLGQLESRLKSLSSPELLIMQSNGGVGSLHDLTVRPVQGILSGPAGGVAGADYYARSVGDRKVITFDVGGTSTDVAIIDGAPQSTTERFEGGWKIAVPTIDVQALGAGGGSIARVDAGGILHVGPESSGAEPGPACYGREGTEPTVTDAAVTLGLIDPMRFLGGQATLSPELAESAIRSRIAEPLGLDVMEAAKGIVEVAGTVVAEGIRLMCLHRGLDARDFTLMGFGGAAGLLASDVARRLGISRVRVPAAAPVLSAVGMLSADIQYNLSRSYSASLTELDINGIAAVIDQLKAEGDTRLSRQRVSYGSVHYLAAADIRYRDQLYEVTVPLPSLDLPSDEFARQLSQSFRARYQELYDYDQADQEVCLATLRMTVAGELQRPSLRYEASNSEGRSTASARQVYLNDWQSTSTYDLDLLRSGEVIGGPALIESDFTVIVLKGGDSAAVDSFGGLEITCAAYGAETTHPSRTVVDPVTLAVVEHRLQSIALEMTDVMLRTAMSQILNSSHDFSTAILDAEGQLLAQGEGLPVHISALPPAVHSVLDLYGEDIHDGDVFIVNDPYFGGSHLPDITVIAPVFFDTRLRFFAVNRSHHSDVGGGTHGGYNPLATEIFHEGIRIPPLRIQEGSTLKTDVLRLLSSNVRQPQTFLGDLGAQIGSVRVASRRVATLVSEYGSDFLLECIHALLDATETRVRREIALWPDGSFDGESFIDDDGFGNEHIPVRARVTIVGDELVVDLSASSPQVSAFLNSSYANTRSMIHASLMFLVGSDVPRNEGSIRPITIVAPEGLIVNATEPAPVCMSTNHCGEEIIEAIFLALAQAVPNLVTAGYSRRLRFAIAGKQHDGRPFIWHNFMALGGGGACAGYDGWPHIGSINAPGGLRSPSVEITEERFPLTVLRYELRTDSGGAGKWRGGLGSVCDIRYEGREARLNTAGDGTAAGPYGLFGGRPGVPHVYEIRRRDGSVQVLASKEAGVELRAGDIIAIESAGGGGYGDPAERPRDAMAEDERAGYISPSGRG